jgi:hypothetical protein
MTAKNAQPKTPTDPPPSEPATTALPLLAGSVAVQTWMDLGTGAVQFIRDRLQQDLQTQQALLACKNLEELQAIQAQFLVTAQQQYAAEIGKMLGLVSGSVVKGLSAAGVKRRYDDVPL